jgi:hypothetical protein
LHTAACKSSEDVIAKALVGTWRDEQGFMRTQALAFFDFSTRQMTACDAQIARQCAAMKPRFAADEPAVPLPRVQAGSKSKQQPSDNARTSLVHLTGVDRVAVTGISASIAPTILAEVGTDMGQFPTVKHCCSWRGLAPHTDISGGSVWRSRTLKVVNRAPQAFRQAAQSVARSDSAFGAYCRSMRARLGPQHAIGATAPKLARVVYHLLHTTSRGVHRGVGGCLYAPAARTGPQASHLPRKDTWLYAHPCRCVSTGMCRLILAQGGVSASDC